MAGKLLGSAPLHKLVAKFSLVNRVEVTKHGGKAAWRTPGFAQLIAQFTGVFASVVKR
jgi:hypothetical protein